MKQITEDYCSFEIAKLLKEKGFDVPTMYFFSADGNKIKFQQAHYIDDVARPTQSLAIKWLREVHKIFVEPFVAIDLNGKYHYCFRLLNSICKDILEPKDLVKIDFKDTYEQAVESALKYALENLI